MEETGRDRAKNSSRSLNDEENPRFIINTISIIFYFLYVNSNINIIYKVYDAQQLIKLKKRIKCTHYFNIIEI